MKLSTYHEVHGLDVILGSVKTGEKLHLHFAKGVARIPCSFEAAGHRSEASFVLSKKMDVTAQDEFDLSVTLEIAKHPGGVMQPLPPPPKPADAEVTKPMRLASKIEEPKNPVKTTVKDRAADGAPMAPPNAPPGPPETPKPEAKVAEPHPLSAMTTLQDPSAVVMDDSHTGKIMNFAPSLMSRPMLTSKDIHNPTYNSGPDHDPMDKEVSESVKERTEDIKASKALIAKQTEEHNVFKQTGQTDPMAASSIQAAAELAQMIDISKAQRNADVEKPAAVTPPAPTTKKQKRY